LAAIVSEALAEARTRHKSELREQERAAVVDREA
jgi:hypothetical protein